MIYTVNIFTIYRPTPRVSGLKPNCTAAALGQKLTPLNIRPQIPSPLQPFSSIPRLKSINHDNVKVKKS